MFAKMAWYMEDDSAAHIMGSILVSVGKHNTLTMFLIISLHLQMREMEK